MSGELYRCVGLSGKNPRDWTKCVKATEGQFYRQRDSPLTSLAWTKLGRMCPVLITLPFASPILPHLLEAWTQSCPK